ncbi:MAG TPA: hypothetical protein VJN90_02040 [Candidatus Acidoferrales bacterium]|nr:hypothetical protein [Candidatus Acidoferrales bacterium]
MITYTVYAALHEETDKGWVWLKIDGAVPRTTIKLVKKGSGDGHTVYCEYRELDKRFVKRYNEHAERFPLPDETNEWKNILVISDWYRRALGGVTLQKSIDLEIIKPRWLHWADVRAACHHPEPGVRVAMRLAVFGTWLALSAFLFALRADYQFSRCYPWLATLLLFTVALGASWGVKGRR